MFNVWYTVIRNSIIIIDNENVEMYAGSAIEAETEAETFIRANRDLVPTDTFTVNSVEEM